MTLMISLLVLALLVQIGIFFYSRKMKKEMKENDILAKYNIKSRSDLFAALNRTDLPEEDLKELQQIYDANDQSE